MRPVIVIGWCFIVACGTTQKKVQVPLEYSAKKLVYASKGAVVSANSLASMAGLDAMQKGGNAFDAAIATQFALAVVYPGAGNIGGGGFLVARTAKGEMISLDYREAAPGAAQKNMYLDSSGNVIQDKSLKGASASGVPGSVAGIIETLRYAKLSLSQLIAPAISLAEKGFAITQAEATSLNELQAEFKAYNTHTTAFQKYVAWKAGDILVQPELAETLKRILKDGKNGFYEGRTAELIVAQMATNGGIISLKDLAAYKAKWRTPHRFPYKSYEVVTMDLPSSAGILLHQMLKMIETQPLQNYQQNSTGAVQLMTEIERRAYADRSLYLGDGDFYKVPSSELTSNAYLRQRMTDYVPGIAATSKIIQPGKLPAKESEQTTHISIIDNEGNAVAVTTTLNDSYGSRTVVAGAGFLLNNEMDDFSIKPGEPNIYGALGGEANAIEPGKRMLSSMSPTIVMKEGKPFLVLGTPGGTTIPTSVFQTILNIIDFKLSTSDAVNKPKFHHQWLPDQIDIEPDFPAETKTALEKMGYLFFERSEIGRTEVIKVLPDNSFEAVADKRGDDSAAGW